MNRICSVALVALLFSCVSSRGQQVRSDFGPLRELNTEEQPRFEAAKREAEEKVRRLVVKEKPGELHFDLDDHSPLWLTGFRLSVDLVVRFENPEARAWFSTPGRRVLFEAVQQSWENSLNEHGFRDVLVRVSDFYHPTVSNWFHSVTLKEIKEGDRSPESIYPVKLGLPELPLGMVLAAVPGESMIRFSVGEDGAVAEILAVKVTQKDLEQPSREAVLKWKFARYPGLKKKAWQPVTLECTFVFKAQDEK